jgi:hypothetical protein
MINLVGVHERKQGKLPQGYIRRAALFASDRIPTGGLGRGELKIVYAGKIRVGQTSYANCWHIRKN